MRLSRYLKVRLTSYLAEERSDLNVEFYRKIKGYLKGTVRDKDIRKLKVNPIFNSGRLELK